MSISSLTNEEKDALLDSIRDTKMTLTELLENTESDVFEKSLKLSFPMITQDAELNFHAWFVAHTHSFLRVSYVDYTVC